MEFASKIKITRGGQHRNSGGQHHQIMQVERSYLKPLPSSTYELKEYTRAKVQKIGYVYFSPDKNYYSVPYRFIGKSTMIHYTQSIIEVYHYHERIALHSRNSSMGMYAGSFHFPLKVLAMSGWVF